MLVDWFTIAAQVLNFILLVWLLTRFLYKPILNAIDAREQRIAKELAAAASQETQARTERDQLKDKNEEFDRQRAELLNTATSAANDERQQLLQKARQEAEAVGAKRQQVILTEARNLNQAVGVRAQQEVFAIARKALKDLADANLEQRMSEVFIQRLRALSGDAKDSIEKALKTSTEARVVRTAFDLPGPQQSAIQYAVNVVFSADIPLRFETAPDLVSGIELSTDGHKLSWSIAGYLTSLEQRVSEMLKDPVKSGSDAKHD